MAAPLESYLYRAIPGCISTDISEGKFSLIFKSEEAADTFDDLYRALWKADRMMGVYCNSYIPPHYTSWKEYAKELGTPHVSVYVVKFDETFTASDLAAKIRSIYEKQ
jgi:hypothetical protein